ncbi:MAG: hypothetical protein JNM84_19935 [Planctomycetes bacterium]|nr:hypothetical protein [Planctomycetota bacterium]
MLRSPYVLTACAMLVIAAPHVAAQGDNGRYRRIQDLTKVLAKEAGELSKHVGELREFSRDLDAHKAEVEAIKTGGFSQEEKADRLLELGVAQFEKVLGKTDAILKVGENRYVLTHRAQVIRKLIASGNEEQDAHLEERKGELQREEAARRKELRRLMALGETRDLSPEEKSALERSVGQLEALQFERNLMEKMRVSMRTLQDRIGNQQKVILHALDRVDSFFQRYDAFTRTMALKLSYLRRQLDNLAVIEDYAQLYRVLDEFHGKGFGELSDELDRINDLFSLEIFQMFSELGGLPTAVEGSAAAPDAAAREENVMHRARTLLDSID